MLCLHLNKFYFKYIKIYIYFKYIKIFKTRPKKKRERDEGNIKQKQKTLHAYFMEMVIKATGKRHTIHIFCTLHDTSDDC